MSASREVRLEAVSFRHLRPWPLISYVVRIGVIGLAGVDRRSACSGDKFGRRHVFIAMTGGFKKPSLFQDRG